MPATNLLTYDDTPPVRPALEDLGGAAKENDPNFPPIPGVMPMAEEDNQKTQQIAAFAKVVPLAILTVTFAAGTPSIANVKALGTNVTAASFTVVDNGDGDTTIWWASGTVLPPTAGAPIVSQADDTEIDRIRAFYTTVSGSPAVRVKTKLGATGADANFVVEIG